MNTIHIRSRGYSWLAALTAALSMLLSSESVAADTLPRPRLVIPRVKQSPTIDGVMDRGEWDRAAAVTGFIGATGDFGGRMVPYESRIWLAHDGERLYTAVRVELAPGAKPSMRYRKRDDPVYMDSHQVELWLTPPVRGNLTAHQFIGNAYGAIYDVKQVPSLGNVIATWNGNWVLKNHYVEGQYWTAEISVPFSDFDDEVVNGREPWGGMVGVAWPQRSWPYTSGWYKNVDTHALMTMSDQGTCVRIDDLSSLFDNRLAPEFTVVNDGAGSGQFRVEVSVGNTKTEKTVVVQAGGTKKVAFDPTNLPGSGKRTFHARVTGPDGEVLLSGDWLFTPIASDSRAHKAVEPKPWELTTRVGFAPLAMGMKLWADLLECPERGKLQKVRFTVREVGGRKVLSQDVTEFEYDAAEALVWLPKELPFGNYEVLTEFLDRRGGPFASKTDTVEHKDYRSEFLWLDSDKYGETFTVAPPFTPVEISRKTISVWGRRIVMDGALPTQVSSQDEDLLAAPVGLVAVVDGAIVKATQTRAFELTGKTDVRAEFTGQYRVAGLEVELSGYIEFDGIVYYELKAAPRRGAAGDVIDRLYLSIPVKSEHAQYYHSTAGGWSGSFGILSDVDEDGQLWSSDGVADFVPYVGLSDDERGIQWFADTDHNWVLGRDAPCASIVRDGDRTELQVNFVRAKGPAKAFAAKFGLIAFPVKPLPKGWRNACLDNRRHGESTVNLFFGPGHGGCYIDPHDTQKLADALGVDLGGRSPDRVLDELPAGSVKLDPDRVKRVVGDKAAYDSRRDYEDPTTVRNCYFFNASMYFEGNRSPAFRAFFGGDWVLDPPSGWFHLTTTESYQDFFSFHMNLWMKHWIMPGLYFDEAYLGQDYNVFNGNGKVMPDGSVRGTVPLMRQRRFMKRMRQLFIDNKRTPFIWIHSSNYMAPHALSAADVTMFGEDKAPTPYSDIMDTISPTLMRTIGRSQKFGFVPIWMNQAGRGSGAGPKRWFYTRQCYGWCWMHDTSAEYHTSTRGHVLVELRHLWGIDADDVSFLPYWSNERAIATSDAQFIVSAWTRPGGKLLLNVMNLNRDENRSRATLTLTPSALGLRGEFSVYDVEQGSMFGQYTADIREADRLSVEDAEGNKARIAELNDRHRGADGNARYDTSGWKRIGEGRRFEVVVPARDFVTLFIE